MTLLKKLLLPTLIVLFPAAVLAGQSSFEAKVVKIIDGDTITALDGQNTASKSVCTVLMPPKVSRPLDKRLNKR